MRDQKYLFRWVGKHIEKNLKSRVGKTPKLSAANRVEYLRVLEETLVHGLHAKIPGGDYLGNGKSIKLTRPCLCFTELGLGETGNHWRKYGRMAFGFTKAFVAREGGGAVSYINGAQNNPLVRILERLQKMNQRKTGEGDKLEDLDFLWHFFKRMKDAPQPASKPAPRKPAGAKKTTQLSPEDAAAQLAKYPAVMPLPYLDEHEWRLVYNKNTRWTPLDTSPNPQVARFPIQVGSELQVIILPDNYTIQLALQSTAIAEKLNLHSGKPPVQILSLEAILRI